MDNRLCARSIFAGYGKKEVLHGVDIDLRAGEVTALLGANGCGKTTLIKALCGLLPYRGSVLLEGKEVKSFSHKERASLIGYLAQKGGSPMPISAISVVMMGYNPTLPLFGSPSEAQRKRALEVMEDIGIGELSERDFTALSEGQKQLVLLARTVLLRPPLLVLDEPDSALDFDNRSLIMKKLQKTAAEGASVLLCSHDVNFSLRHADRLIFMKNGSITADIYTEAADREALQQAFDSALSGVRVYETEREFLAGDRE